MDDSGEKEGGSRRYIMTAVEDSLRRLKTDWIDLYQMHRVDPRTPIEETLRALDDLIRQGKVRYIGCSNFPAWQMTEAAWTARTCGLNGFVSCQDEYSLVHRAPEAELLPAARKLGFGLLPYFPLASGLLTGKYRRNVRLPAGTRLAKTQRLADRYLTERNWEIAEKLGDFAEARGRTMLELAFTWLLAQSPVASVIAGATRPEQLEQNVKAGKLGADGGGPGGDRPHHRIAVAPAVSGCSDRPCAAFRSPPAPSGRTQAPASRHRLGIMLAQRRAGHRLHPVGPVQAQRRVRHDDRPQRRMVDPLQHAAFVHVRIVHHLDRVAHRGDGDLVAFGRGDDLRFAEADGPGGHQRLGRLHVLGAGGIGAEARVVQQVGAAHRAQQVLPVALGDDMDRDPAVLGLECVVGRADSPAWRLPARGGTLPVRTW